MRRAPIFALLLPLLVIAAAAHAELLARQGDIPLPAVRGRIDHMAVDLARKRLFVAEYGNDTLDVVDLVSGRRLRRISGLDHPQGAVSNGGDGSVRLYRGRDLAPVGIIALGHDADNLRVDPANGDLIVAYGVGGLAVIDPTTRRKIADIKLPAHPEAFWLDAATRRIFANIPDAGEIAVIDLAAARQVARWTVPGLRDNFPMALDRTDGLLALVFRHPPRLVLLDAESGAKNTELPACADADDAHFDAQRRRIYVSCGAGIVAIFQHGTGGYRATGRVRTAPGARTSLFVPELERLYVAAPAASAGSVARLLVFRPLP
jgi:hypothetical protein